MIRSPNTQTTWIIWIIWIARDALMSGIAGENFQYLLSSSPAFLTLSAAIASILVVPRGLVGAFCTLMD
jgi:hypothetical protein